MASKLVWYELTIKEFEAITGVTKPLIRNDKRLEVKIPSGVYNTTKLVLPNALNITDEQAGDIVVLIKVAPIEILDPQSGTTIELIFQTCLHDIGGAGNQDVSRYVERSYLEISRDSFFEAVKWAVWVSGMSRKAAAAFINNNEDKFRNINFFTFAVLDTPQLEAFMESIHGKPVPNRAKKKWQAIHHIATWLMNFSDDDNFRSEVFQRKHNCSELDDTDALKLEKLRFPFIKATNARYLIKTLGDAGIKDDRWVKELFEWGGIGLDELKTRLSVYNIPLGFFDTAFWSYCEMFIPRTELFQEHFNSKFGFLKS